LWRLAAPALGVIACAAAGAWGQNEPGDSTGEVQPRQNQPGDAKPSLRITRASSAIKIDGKLDDEAWAAAVAIDNFTQIDPVEGAPPTQRTVMRLLYDANNLYIGVRCEDTNAQAIIARDMTRDSDLRDDDHITIFLDTFLDRRNGYLFLVGAAGAFSDGLIRAGNPEMEWDGIWYAKATIDDAGWTAEIAIPTQTVSFDPANDSWGFNIHRVIRRNQEIDRWASPRRDQRITTAGNAGTIVGLEDLSQGLGLTVVPSLVGTADFEKGKTDLDPGLDIFYQITPSIVGSLTINTDFAETEVDDRQVNLTRFPLFFPEKRDFFLQDAGLFRFGGIRRSPLPFHSRRIGIVRGDEKEIRAGLKVTGRQDRLSFGVLDVQMKNDDVLGDKNLFAGRFAVDVLKESTVGMIVTNGDPGARGKNALVGWDFHYANSDANGAVLDGDAWVQATRASPTGGPEETDTAFGGRFGYNADPWSAGVFAAQIGEDFRPGLGFVRRLGVREYNVNARYRFRPWDGVRFLRTVDVSGRAGLFTDLDNKVLTASLTLPTVDLRSEAGDFARFGLEINHENLEQPFQISDGVTIATGKYDTTRITSNIGTSPSRVLSGNVFAAYGTFWDGNKFDWGGGIGVQPSARFSAGASFSQNEIRLSGGDFDVQIAAFRTKVQFSPEVTWSNTVQWDNQSNEASFNSRVRYEIVPGRVAYIVFNSGYGTDNSFTTTQSELAVKVGWTWRF
jgi:Domain of unknown function (DUF5916)/Carbohydrate family 9 binding domain-like